MSIRNRVMLATLGLAVVGFVVTLGAQDDKVLIVRDGSVDLSVINSTLDRKQEDRKHKWSKKADYVQVFEDANLADVCSTTKVSPMKFDQVDLKIKDLTDPKAPQDLTIVATNERPGFDKLQLLMPDDWRFVVRANDYRLVRGPRQQYQIRTVTLEQVVITPEGGGATTSHPAKASAELFLCVKFWAHLPPD